MAIFLQSSEHSPVLYLDVTADVQRLIVVFLDEAHQLNVAAVSGGCKSGVGGEGGNGVSCHCVWVAHFNSQWLGHFNSQFLSRFPF